MSVHAIYKNDFERRWPGLEKFLANRWNRTSITKEAHAGRGLVAIKEMSVNRGKSFTYMNHGRSLKFALSLLMVGLFSALPAMAADSSNTPALSATTGQQNQTAYPSVPYKLDQPEMGNSGNWKTTQIFSRIMGAFKSIGRATAEEVRSDIIIRYGKDSSRAWTTIACSQPNETLYGDCRVHEPSFGVGFH